MVVAGLGTGGTLTGIGRALRPRRPGLRLVGVEPAESAVLSGDEPGPHGIQGIGPGFKPAVLDTAQVDAVSAPGCVQALARINADETAQLSLRRWIAARPDWRPA